MSARQASRRNRGSPARAVPPKDVEIVDAFCGIGAWKGRDRLLPYRPADILKLMDHFGVHRALAHSNFTADGGVADLGNEVVATACSQAKGRFLPAFSLRPNPHRGEPTVADTMRAMSVAGSRAVWLTPGTQALWPWLYEEILGTCAKRRIPTFLHRDLVSPDDIVKACEAQSRLRLVLVGVGYGDDWWLYPLMRRFPHVSVCLGHFYIPSHGPMRFLEHFPADRLLFGSGLPGFSPGGLIAHVMYAEISVLDREKILSRNLLRLLREADV